jgi:hypothetical protein
MWSDPFPDATAEALAAAVANATSLGGWSTPRNATAAWLGTQLAAVQALQEVEEVGVFVGTWNVNGKLPLDDITPWLRGRLPRGPFTTGPAADGVGGDGAGVDGFCGGGGGGEQTDSDGPADDVLLSGSLFPRMWVFCLQEMVDLDAANMVVDENSKKRLAEWEHLLMRVVLDHVRAQPDERVRRLKYSVVASDVMVGVAMVLVMEDALKAQLRLNLVEAEQVGTGALDLGNKGGIGMRMDLRDTSVLFVSSHLAAHREKVQERNDDFHAISQRLLFEKVQTSQDQMEKSGLSEAISCVARRWAAWSSEFCCDRRCGMCVCVRVEWGSAANNPHTTQSLPTL